MSKKSEFVSYYENPIPSTSGVTQHFQETRRSLYNTEPNPGEIPEKSKSEWEVMRIEIKKAYTREEHHENVRKIVKAYARRKNINLQFTLYDETCQGHESKKMKYANRESTSECQELMDTMSLNNSK
jgi:vacuolar-type H+-ATPase subunit B/Vma2